MEKDHGWVANKLQTVKWCLPSGTGDATGETVWLPLHNRYSLQQRWSTNRIRRCGGYHLFTVVLSTTNVVACSVVWSSSLSLCPCLCPSVCLLNSVYAWWMSKETVAQWLAGPCQWLTVGKSWHQMAAPHDHPPHTARACLALSLPSLHSAHSGQPGTCLDRHPYSAGMGDSHMSVVLTFGVRGGSTTDCACSSPSMIDDWLIYNTQNQQYFTTAKSSTIFISYAILPLATHCNAFPMQQWWYDRNGYTLCHHNDVQIPSVHHTIACASWRP